MPSPGTHCHGLMAKLFHHCEIFTSKNIQLHAGYPVLLWSALTTNSWSHIKALLWWIGELLGEMLSLFTTVISFCGFSSCMYIYSAYYWKFCNEYNYLQAHDSESIIMYTPQCMYSRAYRLYKPLTYSLYPTPTLRLYKEKWVGGYWSTLLVSCTDNTSLCEQSNDCK